ncbi:uncharacterized protein [Bos indicus]|uniref:Uncharacterized protein n=1 Tax=Bos indicus TaxID=9915 RepID=A0ABM4T5F1_BOSIN
MMIPDNGDGPWIQGQAHLWAKMRSGGGDDAQRAGDAQSWPGRLHGPPPPPPALEGCRSPARLGPPVPPPPPRARARWIPCRARKRRSHPGQTRRRHPFTCSAGPETVAPGPVHPGSALRASHPHPQATCPGGSVFQREKA